MKLMPKSPTDGTLWPVLAVSLAVISCAGPAGPTFDPLALEVQSLASGVVGESYLQSLLANGGDGVFSWELAAGALPAGLVLDPASGVISGVPTAPGSHAFTVDVRSGDGQTAVRPFSITVYAPVQVTTPTLADGVEGLAYSQKLGASGGDGSYSWLVTAGLLPPGLGLEPSTGAISGFPVAGTYDFTVEAASGDGQTAQQALSITVDQLILQPSDLCSANPSTALVTFADANLEAAVRAALGISAQADLTCATAATLTLLIANSAGITSLVGAQNLVGLTVLVLDGNAISDVASLTTLGKLGVLSLLGNSLTDVSPLSGLAGLKGLNLDNNQIVDVSPLAGLDRLTSLQLNTNSITDASPLGSLTGLEILDLGSNAISDVSGLATLTSLNHLTLSFNSITDIGALISLTGLETVMLTGNTSLSDIQPLLSNSGLGSGDFVALGQTAVSCVDVALLEANGVTVVSDCP